MSKNSILTPGQTNNPDTAPYDTTKQITENFQRWWSAMAASHAILMAGLRDRMGECGDVQQAYREWQSQRRARKMRAYAKAAERWRRRQIDQGKACEAPDGS